MGNLLLVEERNTGVWDMSVHFAMIMIIATIIATILDGSTNRDLPVDR